MELLKKLNGLQEQRNGESDSFVMDMERFSHLNEEDINAIARATTLQRNLSRKGVGKGGNNKKLNQTNLNEPLMLTSSPRATGNITPEKLSVLLANRPDDHLQAHHHQITITKCGRTTPPATESKLTHKFFRRSPKRILLFFATLSSTGTMLLLYFTLSMSNPEYGSSLSS